MDPHLEQERSSASSLSLQQLTIFHQRTKSAEKWKLLNLIAFASFFRTITKHSNTESKFRVLGVLKNMKKYAVRWESTKKEVANGKDFGREA
jgi:hypothetical protein